MASQRAPRPARGSPKYLHELGRSADPSLAHEGPPVVFPSEVWAISAFIQERPHRRVTKGGIMVRVVAAAVVAVSSIIVAGCGGAGDSPTTVTVRDTATSS